MLVLKSIKRKIYKLVYPDTEFSKRIKFRYSAFWECDKSKLPILSANDNLELWMSGKNWQRTLENKRNSREFAIKHGCKVPELYRYGLELNDLSLDTLPRNYVLKPTMGYSSNFVFLMNEGVNLLDGKIYNTGQLIELIRAYKAFNPEAEFLIEEFVPDESGKYVVPVDYKFYMFNGKVGCIQVINRSNVVDGRKFGTTSYYTEEWNQITKIKSSAFEDGTFQEPPKCFEEMLNAARTLSKAYQIFVRIDFYATCKGAVFGEFCPTPSGGHGFTRYGSDLLVEMWDKYCNGSI